MPESDPSLTTLFAEALERTDPAARASYLDTACGDDTDLRRRVESLLTALGGVGRFLEPDATSQFESNSTVTTKTTIDSVSETADHSDLASRDDQPEFARPTLAGVSRVDQRAGFVAGRIIGGRYTLLEIIGEGGMGTVYRADQTIPVKRQVALKLIKIGMDSRVVLARFDAERQALALMDHPNIARVFDGGTADAGQPFFVMELVIGEPITTYCDRKRLSVPSRLELFVFVCHAVQHAHQKGIIHRDLKPGNVLVTEVDGRATPKVIDFGVAKATEFSLTDQSLDDTGAIVGTPTYMSPEQADPSSMDIDTRTDVYALGVILYELLAGSPPLDARQFKRGAMLEMLRMVREVAPPRPSVKLSTAEVLPSIAANRGIEPVQLKRALQGDLDWIVMKALEKDRARRYDTANGFAADLIRHLASEPVLAAPPSRAYRLQKFVRKNRGAVIAATLLLLTLLGGIAGTTWGLFRADRALTAEANRVKERDSALKKEAERVKERDVAVQLANQRADDLKYRLGITDLILANVAYANRDVVLADKRLEDVPREQRHWAWYYLKRLTRGGLFTLYTGGASNASFSPDGTRIVTGGESMNIRDTARARVWDAQTGTLVLEIDCHTKTLRGASFSPDGTRIVTSGDLSATILDARTGTLLLELKGHTDPVSGASFSSDGTRIVTSSDDRTAKVWDAASGKILVELKGHTKAVMAASFSRDGSRVVTISNDNTTKVWDARTGGPLLEIKGHAGWSKSVAFSPDGTRIVTGGSPGTTAKVWDSRTGAPLLELIGHTEMVWSVAFSPDGTRIATGCADGSAKVWDSRTGTPLLDLVGHAYGLDSVSFSPDGTRIITGSQDGTAKVWDSRTDSSVVELKDQNRWVRSVAFSPDSTKVVTGSQDDKAVVWDARSGARLVELEGFANRVNGASFSPDGTKIVTGSNDMTTKVWDAATGKIVRELRGRTGSVNCVAFSPDGTRIVAGGLDKSTTVWDAATGKVLLELRGRVTRVKCVTFSPDGARIVTGGDNNTATVWDAVTGKIVLELRGRMGHWETRTTSVSYSRDGTRIVTGGYDGSVNVWEARTGKNLIEFDCHSVGLESVAFSPDAAEIVTGGSLTTKIWDARTGTPLLELKGHKDSVLCVAISPDGTRIVTGSVDGTARVWDAEKSGTRDRTVLHELKGRVESVRFSLDGTRIVAFHADRTATVLDARTGQELRGEPVPDQSKLGRNSPDKRWFAHLVGERFDLVTMQPNADAIETRRLLMRPNPWRYRQDYEEAMKVGDTFAADFYRKLLPPSERTQQPTP